LEEKLTIDFHYAAMGYAIWKGVQAQDEANDAMHAYLDQMIPIWQARVDALSD